MIPLTLDFTISIWSKTSGLLPNHHSQLSGALENGLLISTHTACVELKDIVSEADDVGLFEGDVGLVRDPQVVHKRLEKIMYMCLHVNSRLLHESPLTCGWFSNQRRIVNMYLFVFKNKKEQDILSFPTYSISLPAGETTKWAVTQSN